MPELGLPGLGGIFESTRRRPRSRSTNRSPAPACPTRPCSAPSAPCRWCKPRDGGAWRRVDFRNLGAEELGSVYESLLELIPRYDPPSSSPSRWRHWPATSARRPAPTTRPPSLVECLLDSALDPVLDEACSARDRRGTRRGAARRHRLRPGLRLRPLPRRRRPPHRQAPRRRGDRRARATRRRGPGSAARRRRPLHLRRRHQPDGRRAGQGLASGWKRWSPASRCRFLDQNIRVGNSLLGTTPALLADGLPDAAFTPIDGDDRKVAAALQEAERQRAPGPARPVQPGRHPRHQRGPGQARRRDRPRTARQPGRPAHPPAAPGPGTRRLTPNAASRSSSPTPGAPRSSSPRPPSPAPPRSPRRSWSSSARTPARWTRPPPRTWSPTSPASTASSTGTSSSRTSSASATAPPTSTQPPAGPAASPASSATHPGSESSSRSRSSSPPASPEIANAANAAARKKMIAALADSDRPADRRCTTSSRPSCARPKAGATCSATPAVTRSPAAATSTPTPSSPRPPARSSTRRGRSGVVAAHRNRHRRDDRAVLQRPGPQRQARVVPGLRERGIPAQPSRPPVGSLLPAHSLRPSAVMSTRASFAFGTRYMQRSSDAPVHAAARGDPARQPEHRHHAPSSDPAATPRSRSASTGASLSSGATTPRRTRGACRSWRCSTWPTTPACSALADQLEATAGRLTGNVFVRGSERMLPLYEAKMIHHFDHRLGTYEGQTEAQANMGTLPRLTPEQQDDPGFVVMPRYWVQEFDTLDKQKSKPISRSTSMASHRQLEAKHWDRDWLSAGATSAEALMSERSSLALSQALQCGNKFLPCFHWSTTRLSAAR